MYGFRSARGRAIFVGLVLTVFLVCVTALTVWRNEDHNRHQDRVERASDTAAALEHARAQLYLQMSLLSGLAFSQDAALLDEYDQAQAALERDLIRVRAEATKDGDAGQLALLDDLSLRMAEFETTANLAIPRVLGMAPPVAGELAASYLPSVRDQVDVMFADIDQLAESGRAELAAERAALDDEATVSFWLIVARSAAAFVLTAGIAMVVLRSILRPLSSLRLSARAIAAGNLQARAKVFGPEEVASLAQDFNRMTDSLAAKTEEYITTTNLTGDIICKVDARGRWTFLNDAACEFFGKPRERLLGTEAMASVRAEDAEGTRQASNEARARKEPVKGFVNRMVTHAGTRVVEWNAYPLFDERGEWTGIQMTGRDVTERMQAEEALRQSEEKYRDLVENINEVVYALDADGVVTYVSPAVERLGGYAPAEVIGRSFTEFIHPDDLPSLMQSYQRTVSGNPEPFEYRILAKSGEAHWVRTCSRVVWQGERVVGVRAVLMDITDRKQAEEALRESEQKYRWLVEDSVDGLAIVEGSEVRFANPAALEMLGCQSQDEMVGHSFTEFVSPEYRELMMERADARQKGEDPPSRYEINALRKDGSEFSAELCIGRITYQGRVALQAIVRDITDRERSERALRQAEQRYRELFEEAPAMYVLCRDQGGVPVITDCNESFLTTLGYDRDEVVGRPVADFYTSESAAQLAEGGGFQRALAGHFVEEERQLVTKDGRIVETVLRAMPEAGRDGRVLSTRAMYIDITERKRAEEALRESETLYRLLAENTSDLIWTMDLSLRYTYMSPGITRMRGYTVEEIMGTTVQETMTPASLEVARKTLAEQLALEREGDADPNRSTKLELEMYCKDGSTIWTEMNMTFLRNSDGRPSGILGVTRDITERRQAETALRTKDKAIASSINAFALADLEGSLTYVNPSLLKMWGFDSEAEILGRNVSEFWQTREKALQVGRALRDKGNWSGELVAIRKDGSPFYVDMLASTVADEAGNPICMMGSFVEITERKLAERALEESERRYRLLAENASDIIWTMDMSLRFTYQSPSVERIRGYTPAEAMALTIEETLTPASLEVARKALAEELVPGKMDTNLSRSRTLELEHTRKDGSTVWLEVTTAFLRDEDGRPVGLLGVSRDISERKQAEKELEESERRYRLIGENATDLIWTTDMNLRYTYISPSVLRLRGYTVEEAMAHSVDQDLCPSSLDLAMKAYAEEVASEERRRQPRYRWRTLELEHVCKDGSTIWLEVTMTFLRDEGGGRVGILGVSRDITERREAKQALEESEKRYRLLAENVSDVIFTTDLSLRYTYVSPSVTRMRGYGVEEVMVSSLADSLAPHSLDLARKVITQELAKEASGRRNLARSRTVEVELNHKDGHTIWAEVTATFLRDADGNPVGLLGVSRDITERKRADEERKRLHDELQTRAITDSLTGLYNHAYFYQRLAGEIERSGRYGHRFALVMMDVDAFKHYNDSRGHQAGDEALRLVGECIRSAMRRSDLAFRYGGDEFVAILLNADVPRAQAVVRRINRRIAARLKDLGDSAGAWLGVSAGVACFPDDATRVDELVGMADAAMYDAKRLAWARGVMGRRQAVESVACPTELVHETQTRMLSGAASSLAAALEDLTSPQRLSETDLRTLAALGAAAEVRDPYILGHQERTSRLAATVAKELGLPPDRVRNITTAGLLHDLGKISVGESILNKPGKLSRSEFTKMKEHPTLGASMVISGAEALQPLAPIIRHHHESFDGSGYPDGLARENIPLEARILSVADAFDAMTHERAYRKALTTEEALGEIERGAGTRFDRAVVDAFLGVVRRRGGEPG